MLAACVRSRCGAALVRALGTASTPPASAAAAVEATTVQPAAAAPAPSSPPAQDAEATIEDFMKLRLVTAVVRTVEPHPNADRLWVVKLDDGSGTERTICAGLRDAFTAEQLTGQSVVVVANLKPRKLRGIMSHGMLLAASGPEGQALSLVSGGAAPPGSLVR